MHGETTLAPIALPLLSHPSRKGTRVIAVLAPPRTRPLDPKIELRDYQQKTVDRLASPPDDVTRSLAVLPTGTGKTIVFAALLDRLLKRGERALVIAHREELLQQARD